MKFSQNFPNYDMLKIIINSVVQETFLGLLYNILNLVQQSIKLAKRSCFLYTKVKRAKMYICDLCKTF